MGKFLAWALPVSLVGTVSMIRPAWGNTALFVAYPPDNHETVSDQIFFIGTGDPDQPIEINGQVIEPRSPAGHFAPSLPLTMGENVFTLTQGDESLTLRITRLPTQPELPAGTAFVEGSLLPAVNLARLPGELVCLGASAPANAQVTVSFSGQTLTLEPQAAPDLPPNSAVLTSQNTPLAASGPTRYEGCFTAEAAGNLGAPTYQLRLNGQTLTQTAPGTLEILPATRFEVAEVTAEAGTARTGPSTDYSRLTPLPQGTRATVTGREGDWLRLDYGGWIRAAETRVFSSAVPPRSLIRSITSRQLEDRTEVRFPLQVPVPVSVNQTAGSLALTLHNTTPQTDTIFFSSDPAVERLDWRPLLPDKAEYTFQFRGDQQWGYTLRYEGTTLVLALKHPPTVSQPGTLRGTTILLDPGHGSDEDLGARGPNGYPEKDVALAVSLLLRDELVARGARVIMTREGDDDVLPNQRAEQIQRDEPDLALSIHYNALPDSGDALNTAGVGTFWYHAQAHDLAVFLHDYLVETLDRPSYGVFWNNLALTRPAVAPSVLLELGFMINPFEFEWIVDPASQQALARALADGVEEWVSQKTQ
ncbi:MAG: N-acetylmuramoyl-L-alanine amidase [Cyanobacteria bacterium Co-bin13]|nr:N-acetylmuramoyl-L-alanine amidase [Cyanobacteria bacterium Co-bin13]